MNLPIGVLVADEHRQCLSEIRAYVEYYFSLLLISSKSLGLGDCRRISRDCGVPLKNYDCPVLNENFDKQFISLQSSRPIHTLIHIHVSYAWKL